MSLLCPSLSVCRGLVSSHSCLYHDCSRIVPIFQVAVGRVIQVLGVKWAVGGLVYRLVCFPVAVDGGYCAESVVSLGFLPSVTDSAGFAAASL